MRLNGIRRTETCSACKIGNLRLTNAGESSIQQEPLPEGQRRHVMHAQHQRHEKPEPEEAAPGRSPEQRETGRADGQQQRCSRAAEEREEQGRRRHGPGRVAWLRSGRAAEPFQHAEDVGEIIGPHPLSAELVRRVQRASAASAPRVACERARSTHSDAVCASSCVPLRYNCAIATR